MSTIRIQTAQNVAVEYDTASVGDRIVAKLIDSLVLILYSVAMGFALDKLVSSGKLQNSLFIVLVAGPWLIYYPFCEILFNGQSIGKHFRQIKVTRLNGTRPGLGDYLLRWLIGLFEVQITQGTVALLAVVINGRGQRLGDMAAGTTVVSLRPRDKEGLDLGFIPEGYQVVFSQAALLSDHDASLVRRLLYQALRRENYVLLNEVSGKVKALTGIQTDLHDEAFLRTILRDHTALLQQELVH